MTTNKILSGIKEEPSNINYQTAFSLKSYIKQQGVTEEAAQIMTSQIMLLSKQNGEPYHKLADEMIAAEKDGGMSFSEATQLKLNTATRGEKKILKYENRPASSTLNKTLPLYSPLATSQPVWFHPLAVSLAPSERIQQDRRFVGTIKVENPDNRPVMTISAIQYPAWLESYNVITPSNAQHTREVTIEGTPLAEHANQYHMMIIRATNQYGRYTDYQYQFYVHDVNDAPIIVSVPVVTVTNIVPVTVGTEYEYMLEVTDEDFIHDPSHDVNVTVTVGTTNWLTVDKISRTSFRLFGNPVLESNPAVNVYITATDSAGAVDTQQFVMSVYPDLSAPPVCVVPTQNSYGKAITRSTTGTYWVLDYNNVGSDMIYELDDNFVLTGNTIDATVPGVYSAQYIACSSTHMYVLSRAVLFTYLLDGTFVTSYSLAAVYHNTRGLAYNTATDQIYAINSTGIIFYYSNSSGDYVGDYDRRNDFQGDPIGMEYDPVRNCIWVGDDEVNHAGSRFNAVYKYSTTFTKTGNTYVPLFDQNGSDLRDISLSGCPDQLVGTYRIWTTAWEDRIEGFPLT